LTSVTRLVDALRNVPFPGGHGSNAHSRVITVVEPVVPPLIVFTTVTVQSIAVVAPPGPGPMSLHWAIARSAARATDG